MVVQTIRLAPLIATPADVRFDVAHDYMRDAMRYRLSWTINGARRGVDYTVDVRELHEAIAVVDPLERIVSGGAAMAKEIEQLRTVNGALIERMTSLSDAIGVCHRLLAQHNIQIPGVSGAAPNPPEEK